MKHPWRPYTEAKAFVHTLGFQNRQEWKAYCRSGQRPEDLPSHPETSYQSQWNGWGEFLGTGTIASFQRTFLPFEEARSRVHALNLQDPKAWKSACTTGAISVTIPHTPQKTYQTEWQAWADWLGSTSMRPRKYAFVCFEEARTRVQSLRLGSTRHWRAYCNSKDRSPLIPTNPHLVYAKDWKGWGDFLGTGRPTLHRSYLPFEEARAFARSLGLRTAKEWGAYCSSGRKPANIPRKPRSIYGESFTGMGDWLGTGRIATYQRTFLPFEEARAFARSLCLKTREEWDASYEAGHIPLSIPKAAQHVYHTDFRGWWDWLGIVHQWRKKTLIALLESLQPVLPLLSERELYVILQQGGALPALRLALGACSTRTVLHRILTQKDQLLREIQTIEQDLSTIAVQASDRNSNEQAPEDAESIPQTFLSEYLDTTVQQNASTDADPSSLLHPQRKEHLHLIASLALLPGGLDEDVLEYLITSRVNALWEVYSQEGSQAIHDLLGEEEGKNDRFFSEIKRRFLREVEAVERLNWTEGWACTINGQPAKPNLMQRRIAWLVREKRRVGNWSGY